ncbi:MAG TPA: hemerythrin domain-containing protein [Verrucomicrobiae bacterium]
MKITDALIAEHAIYLGVFDEIERVLPSLTTPSELQTMAGIITRILQPHALDENNLAYLALDHALAHKGKLERMHHEHKEIDERLMKVHETGNCSEGRRLLKAAIAASREHFQLEEREVFPLLEKTLKPESLEALGRSWLGRKGTIN